MGKEEKGAREAETDNSLGKAPRLEPMDPVRGDVEVNVAGDAEEGVISDASKECEHFIFDTMEMYQFLEKIKSLKHRPECTACKLDTTAGQLTVKESKSRFVMCSGCSQCFCAGLATNKDQPKGHAQHHKCHEQPVVLWIDQPDAAYCFQCRGSLNLNMIASAARAHGPYVVRGILNRGNTCFVNALVQCLLALGKMRMSMFEPDAPAGSLGVALKDFFGETMAGNVAGATLNPDRLLDSLGALKTKYKKRTQGDSHELLIYLRDGLIDEELRKRPPEMPKDVPIVVDSIFQGQLFETLTCKCCLKQSPRPVEPFYDLSLNLPPKGHPTKSIAPQRRSRRERKDIRDLFQQIRKEDEHKSADEYKSADEHKVDCLPSIEECMEYYFRKEEVIRNCDSCIKDEEPSTSRSKDGGQMVASINESTSVDWDQTERDHHGKAEEKSDLFSAHDNQNASTLNQDIRMEIELENIAHQVGESPNKQKGRQADKAIVLSTLPPVLTLHVARFVDTEKRLGHVKFEENLDVGEYLDPRSEDKKDARYHLVGVIEHIGNSLKKGHYVAYVRGSRTGSKQQQSSGSSTWFRVSDSIIREVSLANVLKCEAYLLFYERIED